VVAALDMVPEPSRPPVPVLDVPDDGHTLVHHSEVDEHGGDGVLDTRPRNLELQGAVGGDTPSLAGRVARVEQAVLVAEVVAADRRQGVADALRRKAGAPTDECGEPLAVELVGHASLVGTPSFRHLSPQDVVLTVPQLLEALRGPAVPGSPALGARAVAQVLRHEHRGLQGRNPEAGDVGGAAVQIPDIVGLALAAVVGESVAIGVEEGCVLDSLDDGRPQALHVGLVAGPEVVSGDEEHELGTHVHPLELVVRRREVGPEHVGDAPILALEAGAHLHLTLLQLGEQGQEGEGALVGDVRRVEAAAAESLPHTEITRLGPPRALRDGGELRAHRLGDGRIQAR